MSLNWIVPGRRAAVTDRVGYRDVLDAWIAALREDELRSTLLDWYGPLCGHRSSMAGAYDAALDRAERWVEAFFAEPPPEREHAHAPGDPATINVEGFWLRLWKGPYRVLQEHAADHRPDPEDPESLGRVSPELLELDVHGRLALRVDAHRRVLNPDAEFLPGDLVELPIFRIMWLAGVSSFQGAHFNGQGSPFLGTSVSDGSGASPGALRIHDNLGAMRFQLMLNLARGAFYSLESSFKAGSMRDKSNQVEVLGDEVHARGMVYGGSLGRVTRRASATVRRGPRRHRETVPRRNPAYVFADNQWAREGSTNAPTRASLGQLADSTRLTTAWACTPCSLALTKVMTETRSGPAYGGINKTLRHRETAASIRENLTLHYFEHRIWGVNRSYGASEALAYLFERAGGEGEPDVEFLRERAMRELFGDRARRQISEEEDRQATERLLEEARDAPDQEEELDHDNPGPPPEIELEIELDEDAAEGEDPLDFLFAEEPDEPDEDAPIDWHALLPPGETIELSRDELLDFFDGALNVVGLNGHEFTYVRLHEPERLLEQPVVEQDGVALGPPLSGPLCAYNPLDGRPIYEAEDERGELYIFEATGNLMPTNLPGDLRLKAFGMRPARWERVEKLVFEADRNGTLRLGENPQGRRARVRRKPLVSVAKFSQPRLDAVHLEPRALLPVTLQARANALEERCRLHDYPERAVPFHTLDESSADPQFAPLDEANDTRRTLANNLSPDRVRAAINAWMDANPRVLERRRARLRHQRIAGMRSAINLRNRLRRRLDSRYPPAGSGPVEARASFLRAIDEFKHAHNAAARAVADAERDLEAARDARRQAYKLTQHAELRPEGMSDRDAWHALRTCNEHRREAQRELRARQRELDRLPGHQERQLLEAARNVSRSVRRYAGDEEVARVAERLGVRIPTDHPAELIDWDRESRTALFNEMNQRIRHIRQELGTH